MEEAKRALGMLSTRDQLILLLGIYWGEGTKKDFAIINSDPMLLKIFVDSLRTVFKIRPTRLSAGLRVHRGISISAAKRFWSNIVGIPTEAFYRVEVIDGKKKGKLPYGMCRVRVRSGIRERLLVQDMIALIGKGVKKKVLSH